MPVSGLVVWINIASFLAELLSHEAFHVLSAKSYGIESTIGVGTRFIDFVLELEFRDVINGTSYVEWFFFGFSVQFSF